VRRTAAALLVATVLLAGTVVAERALQGVERQDPMGRKLLYLPSAEMLRLASLGNPGLVADLFYLWSIQYYSKYQPHEQFLYLETVYDLITDLDPLYYDAYRVGALIMQIPTTEEASHKAAVIRLFDKGISNMPDNYEIAETAAWDMYVRYRDKTEALRYMQSAAEIPGSPNRLKRFLTRWSEDQDNWSVDTAIAYWEEVLGEAKTDYDREVCQKQIYRLVASRDEAVLNPKLADWSARHGRCPESWDVLVKEGRLSEIPVDYFGRAYRILPESCTVTGLDSVQLN